MASKNKPETILDIGAEGASLTLLGQKVSGGSWRFRMERDERTIAELLSGDDVEGMSDYAFCEKSGWVSSFSQALDMLSPYPLASALPAEGPSRLSERGARGSRKTTRPPSV